MGLSLIVASLLEYHAIGNVNLAVSTLTLIVFGIANAFTTVPATTIIHQNSPSNFQGRIFGFTNTFSNGVSLLPIILTSGVADVFGVPAAMQTIGISVFLFGLFRVRKYFRR